MVQCLTALRSRPTPRERQDEQTRPDLGTVRCARFRARCMGRQSCIDLDAENHHPRHRAQGGASGQGRVRQARLASRGGRHHPSGLPLVVLRDRYTGWLALAAAEGKARTAASWRESTSMVAARVNKPDSAEQAIKNQPGVVTIGGGMPINAAGQMVGAIGVSGALGGANDDVCANFGGMRGGHNPGTQPPRGRLHPMQFRSAGAFNAARGHRHTQAGSLLRRLATTRQHLLPVALFSVLTDVRVRRNRLAHDVRILHRLLADPRCARAETGPRADATGALNRPFRHPSPPTLCPDSI